MDTFRCELTPDRLDRGERELAAALSLAAIRTQDAMRARRAAVAALEDAKVPVVALERPVAGPERSTGAA